MRNDGSKTIFCMFEEKTPCAFHLGTHHHVPSYPWSRSRKMEKQPHAVFSKPPHTCTLCDRPGHLVNQFQDLSKIRDVFFLLVHIPLPTHSNKARISRNHCHIGSQAHHTWNFQYLPCFRVARAVLRQKDVGGTHHPNTKIQRRPTPEVPHLMTPTMCHHLVLLDMLTPTPFIMLILVLRAMSVPATLIVLRHVLCYEHLDNLGSGTHKFTISLKTSLT